jgi:hypothetical protein
MGKPARCNLVRRKTPRFLASCSHSWARFSMLLRISQLKGPPWGQPAQNAPKKRARLLEEVAKLAATAKKRIICHAE